MKQRKTIYLQLIMSLILVISLVTGCVAPGQSADKETNAQTEAGTERRHTPFIRGFFEQLDLKAPPPMKNMRRPTWMPRSTLTR